MRAGAKVLRVSIRELKNRLSHYLRLTKRGEIVEITDRGKPIGRIVPLGSGLEERLEAMAELGLLVRSEGKFSPKTPPARARKGKSVAEILIEDRG